MLHEESGKDYLFAETVDECVGNDRDYYRFNGGV